MASCAACGKSIVFGGVLDKARNRFCNARCLRGGAPVYVAESAAERRVLDVARAIHASPCPECGGPGPVDVHESHQVVSFLIATRWSSKAHLGCRSCARRHQSGALGLALFAGWWGVPWGVLMTPVQIGRNVAALLRRPGGTEPSPMLRRHARAVIAAEQARQALPVSVVGRGFDVVPPPVAQPALPIAEPVVDQ